MDKKSAITIKSRKSKGRRLQNEVASALRATTGLTETDIRPAIMGMRGIDILLSASARHVVQYGIECKNTETLNLWKSWEQARTNASIEGLKPLLVVGRNRTEPLVVMSLDNFLETLK